MRMALALCSAWGLVLVWSGISADWSRLAARVEPFLNGLDGSPVAPPPGRSVVAPVAARIARLLPSEAPSLGRRLAETGSSLSVEGFRYEQACWMLVGGCLGAALPVLGAAAATGPGRLGGAPVLAAVGTAAGFAARDLWLSHRIALRRARVAEDLPVALDLLTLSVMAGESVQAAFARVAARLPGDVGRAFGECLGDIRAGSTTPRALERLPSRLPGRPIARLVDSLCTAIDRGAPLADTLVAQSDDLRDARRRHLLETGGKREILMLIPVVFLILPVIVCFALYPGLVTLDLLVP